MKSDAKLLLLSEARVKGGTFWTVFFLAAALAFWLFDYAGAAEVLGCVTGYFLVSTLVEYWVAKRLKAITRNDGKG